MARQTVEMFRAVSQLNCTCSVKNGELFAKICISVAWGREQGGDILQVLG